LATLHDVGNRTMGLGVSRKVVEFHSRHSPECGHPVYLFTINKPS